jgi:hypothetical protein
MHTGCMDTYPRSSYQEALLRNGYAPREAKMTLMWRKFEVTLTAFSVAKIQMDVLGRE